MAISKRTFSPLPNAIIHSKQNSRRFHEVRTGIILQIVGRNYWNFVFENTEGQQAEVEIESILAGVRHFSP